MSRFLTLAGCLAALAVSAGACSGKKKARRRSPVKPASWAKPQIAPKTARGVKGKVAPLPPAGDELQRPYVFRWPLVDVDVTSLYGIRMHPVVKRLLFHAGIDFRAKRGTPVLATGPGIVKKAAWAPLTGKTVVVHHPGRIATLYAHLDEYLVFAGQQVDAGAPVGLIGSTGRSTAPHLHFSVYRLEKAPRPGPGQTKKRDDKKKKKKGPILKPLDPGEWFGRVVHP